MTPHALALDKPEITTTPIIARSTTEKSASNSKCLIIDNLSLFLLYFDVMDR